MSLYLLIELTKLFTGFPCLNLNFCGYSRHFKREHILHTVTNNHLVSLDILVIMMSVSSASTHPYFEYLHKELVLSTSSDYIQALNVFGRSWHYDQWNFEENYTTTPRMKLLHKIVFFFVLDQLDQKTAEVLKGIEAYETSTCFKRISESF